MKMKTESFFVILLIVLFAIPGYCDWTGFVKTDTCRVTDNGDFNCMVDFSDGTKTITEEVAYFRPKTADDYYKGVANRASTIKDRLAAKSVIDNTVKPEIDSYKKPIAISITTVNGAVTTSYTKEK